MEENTNIGVNEEVQDTQEQNEVKTYTQEEVLALIQSEADKRVTSALKKQASKYEKQLSLSKLDGQAREDAEKDLKIQELQEQLNEFNRIKIKSEVQSVLSDRGLNPKLADYLNLGEDVEEAQQTIAEVDKLVKAMVKAEVEKRVGSTQTKASTTGLDGNITKEQFNRMSIREKTELLHNNPTLYDSLANM